jgi:hypothetical protein
MTSTDPRIKPRSESLSLSLVRCDFHQSACRTTCGVLRNVRSVDRLLTNSYILFHRWLAVLENQKVRYYRVSGGVSDSLNDVDKVDKFSKSKVHHGGSPPELWRPPITDWIRTAEKSSAWRPRIKARSAVTFDYLPGTPGEIYTVKAIKPRISSRGPKTPRAHRTPPHGRELGKA